MARSLPQALLSVRARRRRSRRQPRHLHHACRAARCELGIWVRAADLPKTEHALDALKPAMAWDEDVYGREYDLDVFNIVAVDDFNFGAMENKGLNIFNSRYILADPDTATDYDYDAIAARRRARIFPQLVGQPRHLPRLVPAVAEGRLHRLPRPGLLGRSGLAPRSSGSRMSAALRASQFPEDAGPLAHPIRPDKLSSRSATSTPRRSTTRAPRSSA